MPRTPPRITEGDILMARQTKLKIAAVATALLATFGVASASVATTSSAGTTVVSRGGDHSWCC